jgi:hypothetical protein
MKSTSTFLHLEASAVRSIGILLICLLTLSFSLQAQTSREYTPAQTADLLTDLAAGSYDIYELSTSGGTYELTGTSSTIVTLGRNAIIRAKAGLTKKPVVTVNGTSTSSTATIFVISAENFVLKLEGIEFNGANTNTAGGQPLLVKTNTTALNCKVTVRDCFIHNFNNASGNGTIRFDATGSSLDVQESTFDNCSGRILYFGTSDGNSTTTVNTISNGDVILKNCTFSNITNSVGNANSVINYKSTSGVWAKGKNATIDHCTFYNCILTTDEIFKFRMMSGLISITNCIFDKVDLSLSFVNPDAAAPAQVIDFCYLAGFATPPTGTNTITKTPAYTSVAALNFGLTNKNDFVGKDSKTVGDTRYYSGTTGIQITPEVNFGFDSYPNPANDRMNFVYTLHQGTNVQLNILNASGQLVSTVIQNKYQPAGRYSESINVSDLKDGIYIARFNAGNASRSIKVLLNR